jgi:hypothetical protein
LKEYAQELAGSFEKVTLGNEANKQDAPTEVESMAIDVGEKGEGGAISRRLGGGGGGGGSSSSGAVENGEAQAVRQVLGKINLAQYGDRFLAEGFDSVAALRSLTMEVRNAHRHCHHHRHSHNKNQYACIHYPV